MKRKMFISLPLLILLTGCEFLNNNSQLESEDHIESQTETKVEIESNQNIVLTVEKNYDETNNVVDAIEKVFDSVVVINSYTTSGGYGSGSGVAFAKSDTYTYIITCHHVIDEASSFEVILANSNKYQAAFIGADPETDIAILAIENTDMVISNFIEDSDTLKLGQTAIAIGNPLGTLANTCTTGIISATQRQITMSDGNVETLIQTDAAINSGNSGGGLFNENGQLIGIVNAKYSATGVEGLGFAIPSNIAKFVADELLTNGYVTGRYSLGITISDGVYSTGGFWGDRYQVVYITNVDEDGSAYGYLKTNDIIGKVFIDYQDIEKEDITLDTFTSSDDVISFINDASISIGDSITFTVKRNGYNQTSQDITFEIKQYIYNVK